MILRVRTSSCPRAEFIKLFNMKLSTPTCNEIPKASIRHCLLNRAHGDGRTYSLLFFVRFLVYWRKHLVFN